MDPPDNFHFANDLTMDQKSKILQFKDLSGFEEMKCFQILQSHDWNFEVALDLVLDGAYNDVSMENFQSNNNSNEQNNSPDSTSMGLRHRNVATISENQSSNNNEGNNNNDNNAINNTDGNDNSQNQNNTNNNNNDNGDSGLYMVLWNSATWIFKLPFIIVVNTLHTLYDFFSSIINPTLHYDPNGTVEKFIREYEEKYGQRHPTFNRGTYMQVVEQGKREIRFVLIYIHPSSSSRDIDKYCQNIISSQQFIDLIESENIIFWACSIDYPDGYKAFQSLKANSTPVLALMGLKYNKMVLMKKIEGNSVATLDTVIQQIKQSAHNNLYALIAARLDRQERDMASMIRAQQDAAFEESLRADQEKERKKSEEKAKKEQEERLIKEKLEKELEIKEKISQLKKSLLKQIPMEPEMDDPKSLRIMFKLPNGTRLERRFSNDDPVKYLYYFVYCNEENLINFKLRTNFPTRDLPGHSPAPENDGQNELEMNNTLQKCDLTSNIVLFVHDLDS